MRTPADTMNRGSHGPRRRGKRGPERRTFRRLRELCDEVLASYRVARGEVVVSERDRQDAKELLGKLTPSLGR